MFDSSQLGSEAADNLNEADVKAYLEWLKDTLIPDLHDSSQNQMALDLETLVSLVERAVELGVYKPQFDVPAAREAFRKFVDGYPKG